MLLASTVLTVFWVIYYRGGFAFEDPKTQFNLHPVIMVFGFITLSGFCKYAWLTNLFKLILIYLILSHFDVSNLSLLFTFDCQAMSYVLPCLCNPVCCYWFFDDLGCPQHITIATLLLIAFLVGFDNYGSFLLPIHFGILQVIENNIATLTKYLYNNYFFLVFSFCCAAKKRHTSLDPPWFQVSFKISWLLFIKNQFPFFIIKFMPHWELLHLC